MIRFLYILIFIPVLCFATTELRIDLPENILAGEVISAKAEIVKIEGDANIAKLNNQTLEDTLFVSKVGVIERSSSESNGRVDIQFIFLKPIQKMPLKTTDGAFLIYLTASNITPVKEIKEFILFDWSLPFKLPKWVYLILLSLIAIGIVLYRLYPAWIAKKNLRKEREELWNRLKSAASFDEVMSIWNDRLVYFSHFPDLEKNFRAWEKNTYLIIFKPSMNEEEKLKIKNSYLKFSSELPTRRDYGV